MNSLHTSLSHIWQLGVKELRSLWRDRLLLLFVIWAFSGALYTAAKAAPDRLHRAAIAVVDEDQSPLSQRIVTAFYPPTFMKPTAIGLRGPLLFGIAESERARHFALAIEAGDYARAGQLMTIGHDGDRRVDHHGNPIHQSADSAWLDECAARDFPIEHCPGDALGGAVLGD